ncbi:MAG: Yip1 family protein [Bacteroidales bacterium]
MKNLRPVFERSRQLLAQPVQTWVTIDNEHLSPKALFHAFLKPFLILIALATAIGCYLFTSRFIFSPLYMVGQMAAAVLVQGGGLLVTAWILKEALPNYRLPKDFQGTFTLLCYALVPLFIVTTISAMFPVFILIKVFGFYSVWLFYTGLNPLLRMQEASRVEFTAVSTIIYLVICAFIYTLTHAVVGEL